MYCMKCGKEIEEGQVFCESCLEDMAKYPVRPGTAVQLPRRRDTAAARKTYNWRKTLTPEEQIAKLKKRVHRLTVLWIVSLLLAAALAYPAILYIVEKDHFQLGQNYSLIDSLVGSEE